MHLVITAVSAAHGPSGICRHAANLAMCGALSSEVSQVTVLVGGWQEKYFRGSFTLEHPKIRLVPINIPDSSIARNLWYLQTLPEIAQNLSADIVHLSFPVPFRRSIFRCPTVVTLHDLYPYDIPDNFGVLRALVNRLFLTQCLKEADCVICVSEATLERLKMHIPRVAHGKSVVIHNCVAVRSGPFPQCRSASIPSCPFFLVVAQHRPNKNIMLALKAFQTLMHREEIDRRTMLIVVGNTGPETPAIKRFLRDQFLEKSVRMIADVSDTELMWLYSNCALLIAPSLTEGFGLPVVEALLCGSRVVCSDIPAFREVARDACSYFDVKAALPTAALVAAIRSELEGPVRAVEHPERFSMECIGKQHRDLYVRLRENVAG